MVTIVDYRTGNLGSISNILKKIGEPSIITSGKSEIENAEKLILPGVGAFDTGMRNLLELGLSDILTKKVMQDKIPVLGICLGMQLMSKRSGEGSLPGLGWIDAETRRFNFIDTTEYKIPHMGWNFIRPAKESPLFFNMYADARFYFVHSYYFSPENPADILSTTAYEIEFTSAVQKDNIMGVQFHPEKSHKFGIQLLKNFVEYC